jgi:hypothetical protein
MRLQQYLTFNRRRHLAPQLRPQIPRQRLQGVRDLRWMQPFDQPGHGLTSIFLERFLQGLA